MMMPTKLTLEPTTATLIGNHQIMVVPIGSTEKMNNNGNNVVLQIRKYVEENIISIIAMDLPVIVSTEI